MKYRTANLMAATSIVPAGTTTINITGTDIISRITAIVRLTNNSWVPTGHPAMAITSLQLVNGSDVLHSMPGGYSQAMAFYSSGKRPYNNVSYSANGSARACIPIYFGRWLWDPKYALDPSKFKNLQLKIQHNYLLGGAVPNAATLEVWVDYFNDSPPSPVGFLTAKSVWSHVMVAGETNYVLLPQDYPIRLLAPAVHSLTEEPDVNLDNFQIDEASGKIILSQITTMNHLRMMESMFPEFEEVGDGRSNTTTDVHFYAAAEKNLRPLIMSASDSAVILNQSWSGGGMFNVYGSGIIAINTRATGRCPFGVIPIPMGIMEDDTTWYDVTQASSPRIMLVNGAPGVVGPDYELLTQQSRSY